MRRYEVVFIVHPDLTDEEIKAVSDRYGELIVAQKGNGHQNRGLGQKEISLRYQKTIQRRLFPD